MARALTEDSANVEKLIDSESYQLWKFQIGILFKANELYDIVAINTPLDARDNPWKKKDAIAQKLIVTTVDKKPLMHLLNCNTAYEVWMKISAIYQRDNEQQKCNLLQTFYGLTYDKTTDIAAYVSKLKNIAIRLNALDTKIEDDMLISKILATLPEEFKYFASAWESTERNEKTLDNLTARLIAEEMRNSGRQTDEKPVAFKVTNKKCHKCDKIGHFAKDCRTKFKTNDKETRCFKYNKLGHYAINCNDKQLKNEKTCSICKKNNHEDKDCFFRKKKNNKEEKTDKVAFLANA